MMMQKKTGIQFKFTDQQQESHFMPFIVYVCTALLPLGVIKDKKDSSHKTNGKHATFAKSKLTRY